MARHRSHARVVGGQGPGQVALVARDEGTQIARAAVEVRGRIEGIRDAHLAGRAWHELHQSLRPLGGNGLSLEPGLHADDGHDERRVEAVALGGLRDQPLEIDGPGARRADLLEHLVGNDAPQHAGGHADLAPALEHQHYRVALGPLRRHLHRGPGREQGDVGPGRRRE